MMSSSRFGAILPHQVWQQQRQRPLQRASPLTRTEAFALAHQRRVRVDGRRGHAVCESVQAAVPPHAVPGYAGFPTPGDRLYPGLNRNSTTARTSHERTMNVRRTDRRERDSPPHSPPWRCCSREGLFVARSMAGYSGGHVSARLNRREIDARGRLVVGIGSWGWAPGAALGDSLSNAMLPRADDVISVLLADDEELAHRKGGRIPAQVARLGRLPSRTSRAANTALPKSSWVLSLARA